MRKEIKKRLEKALITLEEPGGSTIRSIIKIINKDSPALSVRKVLEALQEGINEGFLCMYNGRFKLKQQVQPEGESMNASEYCKEEVSQRRGVAKTKTPMSDNGDDASIYVSDDEDDEEEEEDEEDEEFDEDRKDFLRKNMCKRLSDFQTLKRSHNHSSKKAHSRRRKQSRYVSKEENMKKKQAQSKKAQRQRRESEKVGSSVLALTSNEPEKSGRPVAERPDVKKQRGPRCTSMKKDVMIPSKVHIPSVPPSVPQRNNNFNELLRRSPEPVNGPLFDSFSHTADNLGFF